MTALISSRKPSRATLARIVNQGFERHNLKSKKSFEEIKAALERLTDDELFDLALLAIMDSGDELAHKHIFTDACKKAGLL